MTALVERPRPRPRPVLPEPTVVVRPPGARRFRPDIQGLRAVAVAAVVLYHAGVPGISGGYVGVDVFFVISGFLITGHLVRDAATHGRVRFGDFYMRRIRRLLPPALLVLVAVGAIGVAVLPIVQARSLLRDGIFAAGYAMNLRLIDQSVDYQNATAPPSALQHFWSLAVEEQFYLLWPLLVAGCVLVVRHRIGRRAALAGVVLALTAGSFYLSVTVTATDPGTAYFSLQTRAWELGAGALLALGATVLARTPAAVARVAGLCGLSLIVGSALSYDESTPYPGSAAIVPVAGAVLVIAGGMHRVERSAETMLLGRWPMQFIGRSSYAWYLWHWPLLILLAAWQGRELSMVERLVVVVVSFWAAVMTYFLENAAMRSTWRPRRWLPIGLVASGLVALLALGVAPLIKDETGTGRARVVTALAAPDISRVQQELTRSLTIKALPRNLTPALDDAPKDYPWEGRKDCFGDLKATTPRKCVFGDPHGTRTAVLVGDSHADQWLNALEVGARAGGWRIVQLTKAACPVADMPIFNNQLKRRYTECDTFRSRVAAYVRELQPQMIIAGEANALPDRTVTGAEWAAATQRGLRRLATDKTRVVLIGDSPTTNANTTTCLSQHLSDVSACAYARKDAYVVSVDRMASYRALQALAKREGYGYVDTLNFFCNYSYCPAVVGNMVVHRDEGHVTNTYARWLAPMFRSVFEGQSR